ncbi:ribosome biogenesis factor YjgA [Thiopseudomonas acetoxidans]|uniref:Dual-action ribosomal maturation protein DarP n=1 Tax=Thiopseudomonas acetoxidans TaxID=3041622 RepID=A0ABT7SNQ1_9GAMM|nr:ribosome biogenesis factor YjgA [Thiopseudomonas sp. CY1220]MDM7857818.1 ribosome biogenesis factor YjgA [Thiopseudomonas sp. CY1220]
MTDTTDLELNEEKSKSQIKRDMLALQDLGARLAELKPDILQQMQLSDELLKALAESKKHTKHIARKRHNQFLGKLLRGQDLTTIHSVLDLMDSSSRQHNDRFHALERWRERLIVEGDEALQAFMQAYPETDSQHLRGLIRQAQQERAQEKPPTTARKIFRYLRELDDAKMFEQG